MQNFKCILFKMLYFLIYVNLLIFFQVTPNNISGMLLLIYILFVR